MNKTCICGCKRTFDDFSPAQNRKYYLDSCRHKMDRERYGITNHKYYEDGSVFRKMSEIAEKRIIIN